MAPTVEMHFTGTVSFGNGFGSPAIGRPTIRTILSRLGLPNLYSAQCKAPRWSLSKYLCDTNDAGCDKKRVTLSKHLRMFEPYSPYIL